MNYKPFWFDADVDKAYVDKEGKKHLVAIASDDQVDFQRDRMSQLALDKMAAQAKGGLPILETHRSVFEFGRTADAQLTKKGESSQLVIDMILDERFPQSHVLFDEVQAGKSKRQLSIGGKINSKNPRAVHFEETEKGVVRTIDDVILDHIATTRPAQAANERTGFLAAIVKSIEGEWDQDEPSVEKVGASVTDAEREATAGLGFLTRLGRWIIGSPKEDKRVTTTTTSKATAKTVDPVVDSLRRVLAMEKLSQAQATTILSAGELLEAGKDLDKAIELLESVKELPAEAKTLVDETVVTLKAKKPKAEKKEEPKAEKTVEAPPAPPPVLDKNTPPAGQEWDETLKQFVPFKKKPKNGEEEEEDEDEKAKKKMKKAIDEALGGLEKTLDGRYSGSLEKAKADILAGVEDRILDTVGEINKANKAETLKRDEELKKTKEELLKAHAEAGEKIEKAVSEKFSDMEKRVKNLEKAGGVPQTVPADDDADAVRKAQAGGVFKGMWDGALEKARSRM